jgi:predicted RNA-binding Zn-ribbon protein involved in translation (DUF1610 family)
VRPSPDIQAKAEALVTDAIEHGGDLWESISPATLKMLTDAVAMDLADEADIADRLANALALICPHCGHEMEHAKTAYDGDRVTAYIHTCPECGPFHFSDTKPLAPGMPE